ncbi:hypothetical protein Mth01_14510 [Sphaerimonospora thailandensis]|uniref:Uncharacterized protein n=2 Tax=Sphaerimonospora TaxID=1792303 RepID=A0A8J3VYP0_9ACTN|nr:hypothetical protein Mth01_14510 [Sphaerimonospora thailandensis]
MIGPLSGEILGRPGLEAGERRAEAIQCILAGTTIAEVRTALGLDAADERAVADHVRKASPWMAVVTLDPGDPDDWGDCPGISPHPGPPLPGRTELFWCGEVPGLGRVVEHTCLCIMTEYELLSYGGTYRIRRTTIPRAGVPTVSFTGGWRRPEAYEWWFRLLTGQAR